MVSLTKSTCPICGGDLNCYTDHRTCKSCNTEFKLDADNKMLLTRAMMDKMAQKAFAEFPSDYSTQTFVKQYNLNSSYFPAALGVAFLNCNKLHNGRNISNCLDRVYELSKTATEQELRYLNLYGGKPLFLKEGYSLIAFAVVFEKPDLLEILLKRGVSANTPTAVGNMTPLYLVTQITKVSNFEVECRIAELLYKYGGNPKALTTSGTRIVNQNTLPQMKDFLMKLDINFMPPPIITPEEKERWLEDKKRSEKRQRELNEPATWSIGMWIFIIICAIFLSKVINIW